MSTRSSCEAAASPPSRSATRAVGAIPGSWLCVSGPRGNGALGTFVTREEREAWLGRQERLVELVEAGEEAGVEEMMADHFGTVQILGNRLDPEEMIDTHAVRANRISARATTTGMRMDASRGLRSLCSRNQPPSPVRRCVSPAADGCPSEHDESDPWPKSTAPASSMTR